MTDEDGIDTAAPERAPRGHTVRVAFGVALLVIAVAVMVDNRGNTRVGYVFGDVRAPLILVVAIAALFGAALGWLLLHRRH